MKKGKKALIILCIHVSSTQELNLSQLPSVVDPSPALPTPGQRQASEAFFWSFLLLQALQDGQIDQHPQNQFAPPEQFLQQITNEPIPELPRLTPYLNSLWTPKEHIAPQFIPEVDPVTYNGGTSITLVGDPDLSVLQDSHLHQELPPCPYVLSCLLGV
ncbi:hypothetical protein DSO57_1027437 [Entomophthora muscae]|uniref:Uncharacterized protein n=1 Tax=Entomophthora muscae TaxID=34485 RepID=A0ACC2UM36_9FUNG|nr:hypothetical protein DSO57_1027437 [Entomophthora muscae]